MTDRIAAAQSLEQRAAEESSLARSQELATEADRLRRAEAGTFGSFVTHVLRN